MADEFWQNHRKTIFFFPSTGIAILFAWWILNEAELTLRGVASLLGGIAWCVGFGVCAAQDFRTTYFNPVWLWRFCIPGASIFAFGIGGYSNIGVAALFGFIFAAPQIVAVSSSIRALPPSMREDPASKKMLWRLKNWGDIDFALMSGFFIGGYSAVDLSSSIAGFFAASCVLLVSLACVGVYRFRQKTKEAKGERFRELESSMGEHYFAASIVGMWIYPLVSNIFG